MNQQQWTPTDIEKMRAMVQDYDNQHKPVQVHDLNNPPKEPYRYQKFPKMLYNHEQSQPAHEETRSAIVGSSVIEESVHVRAKVVTLIVHSEEDLQAALADGWQTMPPNYSDEPENNLDPKFQREVEGIETQLAAVRRGRLRKEA